MIKNVNIYRVHHSSSAVTMCGTEPLCFWSSVSSSRDAGKEKEDEAEETREKVSVYIQFPPSA